MSRLLRWARLFALFLLILLAMPRASEDPYSLRADILGVARDHSFNYLAWEAEALLSKTKQELWGFHAFIPEENRARLVVDYFALQKQIWDLEANPETPSTQIVALKAQLADWQPLVEHILEGQVSSVLRDEGFAFLGQVLPPVSMHFLKIPDVLIVSPRTEIRQAMTLTLQAMTLDERVELEKQIAAAVPDHAVWITPIGGVGVYPAMVRQTDRAVVAFEIIAHEWTHHYLVFFPLGYNYFTDSETRIINETAASLVGDEIGNRVIERFYADYLESGQVYLQTIPDYRALLTGVDGRQITLPAEVPSRQLNRHLADYLLWVGEKDAAQEVLDQQRKRGLPLPPVQPDQAHWISHTRVTTDYLLSLGMVEAAEQVMENGRRQANLRVLNQAWFAFNMGYQANPVVQAQPDGTNAIVTVGGGGDPIGAGIYELRARAGSLKAFLEAIRGVTTRAELEALLENYRKRE